MSKGDKPYTAKELYLKLSKLWNVAVQWRMVSLGRGFSEFQFSTFEDLRLVWAIGTTNMKSGILRLSQWTMDFTPSMQNQTHSQVWIRLMELPQEYWMIQTLFEIAGAVGTPLLIDAATQNRTFDHYARVLVDVDLSKRIFDEVLVEREGYAF